MGEAGQPIALGDRIGRRPWHLWLALGVIALLVAWFAERTVAAVVQDKRRDFYEFFSAAEAMVNGGDPYNVGKPGYGYLYPPLLATLLTPLVPLGLAKATVVWLALNVGAMSLSAWAAARETLARLGREPTRPLVAAVMAGAILIVSDKLRSELAMGQCNLWMVLSWVLALVWLDRRPWLAGVALGFGANIKYLTLITVPYLVVRGRWKAAAGTVGATAAWGLLPALYLGWGTNLRYLRQAMRGLVGMVKPAAGADVTAGAGATAKVAELSSGFSMSITSWVARVTEGGGSAWMLALLAAIAGAVVGGVWVIYRRNGVALFKGRWGEGERRGVIPGVVAIEWTGLVVAALVFGPQTNSRHLSMVLLPCVTAMAVLLAPGLRARGWPLVVGLVVLWCGMTLPFGTESTRPLRDRWEDIAGPSWCLLAMFFTLVWVGLEEARRRRRESVAARAA